MRTLKSCLPPIWLISHNKFISRKVKRKTHTSKICRRKRSKIMSCSHIFMSKLNLHSHLIIKNRLTLSSLRIIISNMNRKIASTYISKRQNPHQAKNKKKRKNKRMKTRKVSIRMMMLMQLLLSLLRQSIIITLYSSINPQWMTNQSSKINILSSSKRLKMKAKKKKSMLLKLQAAVAVSMSRKSLLSQSIKACSILFKKYSHINILKVSRKSNCCHKI